MAFDYINEAFKKLDLLEEKMFDTSLKGINELSDFLENDDTDEVVRVIDPEAETNEDVQDSYVGKVIINCNICHSHIFENKEDIKIEEDGAVNIEEQCPYCGEQEGFTIVGEIAPFAETKVEVDGEEVEIEPTSSDDDDFDVASVDDASEEPENEVEEDDTKNESLKTSRATHRAMSEDFKEVSVTTGDSHMEMTSDDNGKVTITTEPVTESTSTDDVIAPVSDETQAEILSNNNVEEEPATEEPLDEVQPEETTEEGTTEESEETVDTDVEEVDEDGLDDLGESYLRKVYENVESFKTTSVAANDQALIVEGVIKFTSGSKKTTGFIFEAVDATENGRVRFRGSNKHFSESKDAYTLVGRIDNKKLFVESLGYNYKTNEQAVRGIVRRK